MKKLLNFSLIIFIVISSKFQSSLANTMQRSKANVTATIMKTQSGFSKNTYRFNVDLKDIQKDYNQGEKITYQINSIPNTLVSVDYAGEIESKTSGDFVMIDLKTKNNKTIKMKLDTKNKKLIFDKEGDAEIITKSDLIIDKKENIEGETFEASYYIIIGN